MSQHSVRTGGDQAAYEFAKLWAGDARDRRRAQTWDGRFRKLAYLIPATIVAGLAVFLGSRIFTSGYTELQALSEIFR